MITPRRLTPWACLLLFAASPVAAQVTPQVSFQPERLWLTSGQRVTVDLRVTPPAALGQVWVSGPWREDLEWRRQGQRVELLARRAGSYTLRAQRGQGGPVLATLRVEVQAPLIQRVLERVQAEATDGDARQPLVVFDLDDTLFDTRWRALVNLRAWGESHGEQRLVDLRLEDVRYELAGTLRNAGLSAGEVQGALGRAITAFQSQHWTDYHLDRPFPGALALVQAVEQAGGRVVYVTGRSERRRAASEAVLRAAGFPVEGALRYFRPADDQRSSASYKAIVARHYLPRHGEVVAAFDNEPANCNAFLWANPQALTVHLDTLYPAASPALAAGVEVLSAWE